LALFSHLQHSNHLKHLSNIVQSVVLDENLCRLDKIAPAILNSACAGPKGEAKGRVNPARPTTTEKSAFWRFFRI
jgi:hypothetical protein